MHVTVVHVGYRRTVRIGVKSQLYLLKGWYSYDRVKVSTALAGAMNLGDMVTNYNDDRMSPIDVTEKDAVQLVCKKIAEITKDGAIFCRCTKSECRTNLCKCFKNNVKCSSKCHTKNGINNNCRNHD